jgi:hypothetical protein
LFYLRLVTRWFRATIGEEEVGAQIVDDALDRTVKAGVGLEGTGMVLAVTQGKKQKERKERKKGGGPSCHSERKRRSSDDGRNLDSALSSSTRKI